MKKLLTVLAVLAPSAAMAHSVITNADSLTAKLTALGNTAITILIAAAVIFIIWHAVMFILKASDPEARGQHRSGVLWGIVGLAIILCIWGLVGILTGTFTTQNRTPVEQFPTVTTYHS